MDISPKAHSAHDTIYRPHEAENKEDQSPHGANTETKYGAETEEKAIQRLSHLGIYPIYSHQTQTLL